MNVIFTKHAVNASVACIAYTSNIFICVPWGLVNSSRIFCQLLGRKTNSSHVTIRITYSTLTRNPFKICITHACTSRTITDASVGTFHNWMHIVRFHDRTQPSDISVFQNNSNRINRRKSHNKRISTHWGHVRKEQSLPVHAVLPSGPRKHEHTSYCPQVPCPLQ